MSRFVALLGLLVLVLTASARGADVPLVDAIKMGDSAMVRRLIADGADPNAGETDGTTALHWAARRDDVEAASLLLEAGADVDAANRYGVTPLLLASENGTAMVETFLAAGADPNVASPEGETPLMLSARADSAAAVLALGGAGAEIDATEGWRGQTALMWAASQDSATAARALLDLGAAVQVKSEGGFTPLLFATREGNVETLRVLLDGGGNPDDALPSGMSALVLAVYNAHYDLAVELLDATAM